MIARNRGGSRDSIQTKGLSKLELAMLQVRKVESQNVPDFGGKLERSELFTQLCFAFLFPEWISYLPFDNLLRALTVEEKQGSLSLISKQPLCALISEEIREKLPSRSSSLI